MSLNLMKNELHQRLWGSQERWFALREQGMTKHDLKIAGVKDRNDPWWACRSLIFAGNTRLTYERAIARLHVLDAVAGRPRGYGLAAELQRSCGLRAIEATDRLTPDRLAEGIVSVDGKGGRTRCLRMPQELFHRLEVFFQKSGAPCLAALRPYETAWRRAVLDVGGRSTGTHALRRLWAEEYRGSATASTLRRAWLPRLRRSAPSRTRSRLWATGANAPN
jgi:hypothetical protein